MGKRSLQLWLVVGRVALFGGSLWSSYASSLFPQAKIAPPTDSIHPRVTCFLRPFHLNLPEPSTTPPTPPKSLPPPSPPACRCCCYCQPPSSSLTIIRRSSTHQTRCKLCSIAAALPPPLSRCFRLCCVGLCSLAAWWSAFYLWCSAAVPLPSPFITKTPFSDNLNPFGSRSTSFVTLLFAASDHYQWCLGLAPEFWR